MELWATGFNAWGQLNLEGDPEEDPHDLKEFKCLLLDPLIEVLWTSLSAILVKTSSGLRVAGYPDELTKIICKDEELCCSLAVAGNDKIVRTKLLGFTEHSSLKAFVRGPKPETICVSGITQVVANQTTFTALTEEGEVWSWGDGRYEACLGREVSNSKPASLPRLIEDLLELPTGPIRKISSGGYITAALTTGNDLYVWGGRLGQPKLLEVLSGVPTPIDLECEDIEDVAVGNDHIITLTTTGKLFVIGSGSNGQLGLAKEKVESWKEVNIPLREGQRISKVHAGYKNSFVIVE